jgi:N-acyl-D-amino-acid deacylase
MYMYPASSNGLWSQIPGVGAQRRAGGALQAARRACHARADREGDAAPGKMSRTILVKFRTAGSCGPSSEGRSEDVAKERGTDEVGRHSRPRAQDRSRIQAVYFGMSEANLAKELRQPWVAIGSDGSSTATEGVFLEESTHPRSYGNFARLLGKFVARRRSLPSRRRFAG